MVSGLFPAPLHFKVCSLEWLLHGGPVVLSRFGAWEFGRLRYLLATSS